jgi:hypothetical protein
LYWEIHSPELLSIITETIRKTEQITEYTKELTEKLRDRQRRHRLEI